jgi:hypothetical protein
MKIDEAQKIVNQYGAIYADPTEGDVKLVHPITDLPCSPAKVKLAFFTFTEYLIENNQLSKEQAEALISTYASINTAFREQAEEINKGYRQIFKNFQKEDIEKLNQFEEDYSLQSGTWPSMPSPEAQIEFHNFIADCQGNYHKSRFKP